MTVFEVEDIKKFMALLFRGETFDGMLLVEAEIKTAVTYRVDGSVNPAFFDDDVNREEILEQTFCRWGSVKQLCMDMIKGKRLPVKMKIVLKKPVKEERDRQFSSILSVMYEGGKLMLVTNVSATVFSLERPDNEGWNSYISELMKNNDIFVSTQ